MKVLILGVDGYLGWPLAQHLALRDHQIIGVDWGFRREWVRDVGGNTAIPIATWPKRKEWFTSAHKGSSLITFDICVGDLLAKLIEKEKPDAVVHLAENPSAPYSMMSVHHACYVQMNNVIGTMKLMWAIKEHAPHAAIIKLGSMGEWGTPNIDIPEGSFEVDYRGRKDRLPFPKQPGSWYHASKVHDTTNLMLACRIWGLRATDIMQGVVYGTRTEEIGPGKPDVCRTRLDLDENFGTAVNRFCCQAVTGNPLTVYGEGGQTRGFLPLRDSIQCLTIALENPAEHGEYRVFNQFEKTYKINDLARLVQIATETVLGIQVPIAHIPNPRVEAEQHYYNPESIKLLELGYQPTGDIGGEISGMLEDLSVHRERIRMYEDVFMPKTNWR